MRHWSKGFRKSHKDAIHDDVVKALRDAGRQVVELDGAKGDEPGVPDIAVCWPGGIVFMEIKSDAKAPLNANQVRWHARYRGPRGTLMVVRSVAEALTACGVIVRHAA